MDGSWVRSVDGNVEVGTDDRVEPKKKSNLKYKLIELSDMLKFGKYILRISVIAEILSTTCIHGKKNN